MNALSIFVRTYKQAVDVGDNADNLCYQDTRVYAK